jgi:small subunit ribosomal protein S9
MADAPASTANGTAAVLATGRRKEAVARIRLVPGAGAILVNSLPYEQYFPREALRLAIRSPLILTQQLGKYNVLVNVEGGGTTGQAGAIRMGIARALAEMDPAHRTALRGAGFLTRDPRMKERKKYGLKGARKRFQWTKR